MHEGSKNYQRSACFIRSEHRGESLVGGQSCARGSANLAPVCLGDVCAEALGTLFPKTFPNYARNGSFPVAACRAVSQTEFLQISAARSESPQALRKILVASGRGGEIRTHDLISQQFLRQCVMESHKCTVPKYAPGLCGEPVEITPS